MSTWVHVAKLVFTNTCQKTCWIRSQRCCISSVSSYFLYKYITYISSLFFIWCVTTISMHYTDRNIMRERSIATRLSTNPQLCICLLTILYCILFSMLLLICCFIFNIWFILPLQLSSLNIPIMSSCVKPMVHAKTNPLVLLHGFDRLGTHLNQIGSFGITASH